MMRTTLFALAFASLLGCTPSGYEEFYRQSAPTDYAPVDHTLVFTYRNVDIQEIYDLLFSDFLVLGRASFNGPYEDPDRAASYARSIGADLFIASTQFDETRTSFVNIPVPTTTTTSFSGYSGAGSFYGTATTYGTETTIVPFTVRRYDQRGLFLRNINEVVPLWDRTQEQYARQGSGDLEGEWFSDTYRLSLYRSGEQYVAFIAEEPEELETWKRGQLKLVFGVKSGVGIYLMGNKQPVPARFEVNKFGHLEVTLLTSNRSFSFARSKGYEPP